MKVTREEFNEKLAWIDELFDRVARRHKGYGQELAELKRRVERLEAHLGLERPIEGRPGRPPVTIAPTPEAMPLGDTGYPIARPVGTGWDVV